MHALKLCMDLLLEEHYTGVSSPVYNDQVFSAQLTHFKPK